MNHRTWKVWPASLVVQAILLGGVAAGVAQDSVLPLAEALRTELSTSRSIFTPQDPILLRFTLVNATDEVVEIPVDTPFNAHGAIALPLELVLGTPDAPAVAVEYENEAPRTVAPPETDEAQRGGQRRLRLAPRGTLGAEVDLRAHDRDVRYTGRYRVTWRPLAGQLGTRTTEFVLEPRRDAILVTDHGKVTFRLEYDRAPENVRNFVELVEEGFYDTKTIHRVIPGFVLQAGCPKGDGTGVRPDGRLIPAEFHDAPIVPGTLAMARKRSDPNSASCQFFVALARLDELDGQFTVIGQASDPVSLRTLQALSGVTTDRSDRPTSPLIIRSINLVETDDTRVQHLEYRGRRTVSAAEGQAETPAEEPPDGTK